MPKNVVALLAGGFEEVEAVTPIDYLRRAGIAVTSAAIGDSLLVQGARDIPLRADVLFTELPRTANAAHWDAVIIPGGLRGAQTIAATPEAGALIVELVRLKKWVCAICAAPAVALAPLGILSGRKFTCYPGMEDRAADGVFVEERVVIDRGPAGGIITSRGAGTAGEFALAIIGVLRGEAAADTVARSVLLER
jgi:4-methyl-5(b-hydroxyethyl)-thiazole monophosphate biosynthesis